MRRPILPFILLGWALPTFGAAQDAHPAAGAAPDRPRSEAARARYPQPLRAGDLAGRLVIEDAQEQRVLGRAVAATRGEDGRLGILVMQGGLLGFGARPVVVPMEAVALLGHLLVLKDLDPAQFASLPDAPARPMALPPDSVVRMGLARN